MQASVFDTEIPCLWTGAGDPDYMSVRSWFTKVNNLYRTRNELESSQITALNWFKNDYGLRHEYIVATLKRPENARAFLRIERSLSSTFVSVSEDDQKSINELADAEKKTLLADFSADKKSYRRNFWDSFQCSTELFKATRQASDTVLQVPTSTGQIHEINDRPPPKAKLIATYRNFQTSFPLRDLVFITRAIHEHESKYLFFVNQCYWFAHVLMGIARERYHPTISRGHVYHEAGRYRSFISVISKERTAGEIELIRLMALPKLLHESDLLIERAENEAKRAEVAEKEAERAYEKIRLQEERVQSLERELHEAKRTIKGIRDMVISVA